MRPLSNLHASRDFAGRGVGSGSANASRDPAIPFSDSPFRPVQRPEIHRALQLILGVDGRPAAEEHVVDFLRFAVYRGIDLNDIWVTEQKGRFAWAVLPVISPGRTMLLFTPMQVARGIDPAVVGNWIEQLLKHDRHRAVDLAQVLLDPAEQATFQLFADCKFDLLADLIYLEREVRRAIADGLPSGFSWEIYSDQAHAEFARAISATYEASLDCPALNGRRGIEDVIAGHKSSGEFDPKLWFLLRENGESRGALLLNRSTRTNAMELVYLGLTIPARGRAIGDVLMRHALTTAAHVGARSLTLAVDSRNEPALRLYKRHGFVRVCNRLAMMRDLRSTRADAARDPSKQ